MANASNFVRSESSDNKYIGLLKYGTGHSAYGALAAGGGAVYANSSVPITIMSDGSYINFATGGNTERLRIDSSGRVLIGHSSAVHSTSLQVLGATGNTSSIAVSRFSNSAASPLFIFNKSRNANVGSNTVVQNNDTIGIIRWEGADGTDYSQVADIQVQIDGAPGGNDTPGRIIFGTTADGEQYTTERLRITSGGQVNIGGDYTQTAYNLSVTNTGGNLFRIKTANEGDYDLRFMVQNSESNIWHYGTDDFVIGNRYDRKLHFITNGSKRLTIHGSYIGINQTAPQTGLHINQDWVSSYGSISAEGSANALVGLGLRSNGNYRGSLIWRDGSSGNYMDISTYGGDYPILFRPNGTEKVRINSSGDLGVLKIADNNTSSAGNHGFRFGSWGIQMRDTGGFNHWYIRRNYGGWQTSPQVTFKGNGYTGVNRLDPTHYLDVDGTSIFRDRIFSGTMSMKSIPFGANVTYDTGISINGYGYGGSILALCSRNYGAGTSTQAGLYYLEFKYDGNHVPTIHHVAGDSFVTFNKSASNTLTVHMGASNNNITMIESSVVNP